MTSEPQNIFGVLASGRLVQTNFTQVTTKQFVITIPDADSINFVSVFMTGVAPFPDGLAGLIYFSWPDAAAPPNWQLLGYISNEKPSSVFKLYKLKSNQDLVGTTENSGLLSFNQKNISTVAQIGISVEPIDIVKQQIAIIDKTDSNQSLFYEFAFKTIQNMFNYASSFAMNQSQIVPNPQENYVPLSALTNWYTNFERRLSLNPYFWKNS